MDECPPDMMCAASDESSGDGNASGENMSYGDEDCAHCSGMSNESDGDAEPACEADCPQHAPEGEEPDCGEQECQYSPRAGEDDASSGGDAGTPTSSDNCMDGADAGEACDGNRTYLGAPEGGREADVSDEPTDAGRASDDGRACGVDVRQNTPGVGLVAVLGVLGTVFALMAPHRRHD